MLVPFSSNITAPIGSLMMSMVNYLETSVKNVCEISLQKLWSMLTIEMALEKLLWGKLQGINNMRYDAYQTLKQHAVNLGPGTHVPSRAQTDLLAFLALSNDRVEENLPPFAIWAKDEQNVSLLCSSSFISQLHV